MTSQSSLPVRKSSNKNSFSSKNHKSNRNFREYILYCELNFQSKSFATQIIDSLQAFRPETSQLSSSRSGINRRSSSTEPTTIPFHTSRSSRFSKYLAVVLSRPSIIDTIDSPILGTRGSDQLGRSRQELDWRWKTSELNPTGTLHQLQLFRIFRAGRRCKCSEKNCAQLCQRNIGRW